MRNKEKKEENKQQKRKTETEKAIKALDRFWF